MICPKCGGEMIEGKLPTNRYMLHFVPKSIQTLVMIYILVEHYLIHAIFH